MFGAEPGLWGGGPGAEIGREGRTQHVARGGAVVQPGATPKQQEQLRRGADLGAAEEAAADAATEPTRGDQTQSAEPKRL